MNKLIILLYFFALLAIAIVLDVLWELLSIRIGFKNVFDIKNGKVQRYGYSTSLKIVSTGFAVCIIVILFLLWREHPNIIRSLQAVEDRKEQISILILLFIALVIIYCGFAFLYIGYTLTENELIVRNLLGTKKISYIEIREQAEQCRPVLQKGTLKILLKRKILNISVIQLQEGLSFTNQLMKRCGLQFFLPEDYMAAVFGGEDLYNQQYEKMRKIHKERKSKS